jgi:hypothetical protein
VSDPITLFIPLGETVLLDLDGHQVLVQNRVAPTHPVRLTWENLENGEVKTLMEYKPDAEPDQTIGQALEIKHNRDQGLPYAEPQEPILEAGKHFTVSSDTVAPARPSPFGGGVVLGLPTSLDAMLAAATVQGPTPAEEIIRSSASGPAPAPPPPPALADMLSKVVEAAPDTTPAAAPPPAAPARAADLKDMDAAPRDGSYVMLDTGTERLAGKWSSAFGRQFWVGPDDDSLGFDDSYLGWKLPSEADKEEFGL